MYPRTASRRCRRPRHGLILALAIAVAYGCASSAPKSAYTCTAECFGASGVNHDAPTQDFSVNATDDNDAQTECFAHCPITCPPSGQFTSVGAQRCFCVAK